VNIFFNKNYVEQANVVVKKINYSLTRYCVITVINTFVMIILVYLVLLLLGVKGAFLMATIVGVLNIIPYVGPILGGAIACLLGIIHCVGLGVYTDILPVMIKIIATVIAVNGVDNMVILPLMYSKSIQLHPIESLLITIIAGKIAGMGGMLLGIPVYTVLRIIVIEIYNFVNKENDYDEAPVFKFIRKRNKLNTNNHEDSGLSEI
ncbi:AI-2E family transporter, partial [Paludibacteraceae bacterium OttesenSCG-928-F17]|nr:AI-2E family transporter [Paludibacteraceae bacterium OttesenSCG-928-F17]